MFKRILWVLLILLGLESAGCASLQRKFTRKPKEEPARAIMVVDQGPYQKKYSNDYYYKTHYTMWETWEDDLLMSLGGNHKHVTRAAEEAYSHLVSMSAYLKPEKKAQLEPLVKEFYAMEQKIEADRYSVSDEPVMRSDIERLKRLISNDFYYNKVKGDVLPDTVDLGAASK